MMHRATATALPGAHERVRLSPLTHGGSHYGIMARRVATTGIPRRDERPRNPALATDERPGQGRRDPRPTPPDHGAATPVAQREGAVRPERSGVPGSAAAPTAHRRAPRAAVT